MLKPKLTFHLFEKDSHRFYYGLINKEVRVLAGITTLLSKTVKSDFLDKWKIENNGNGKLEWSAKYGSGVHWATYLMDTKQTDACWDFIEKLPEFEKDKTLKELTAWRNFRKKFKLTLLLAEVPLYANIEGCEYITTVDRIFIRHGKEKCIVEEPTGEVYQKNGKGYEKGDLKRDKDGKPLTRKVEVIREAQPEIWIIDLKSNPFDKEKKEYYDTHLYQLMAQKAAFHQNFKGNLPTKVRIFNWSATDWREDNGDNTYTLTEWRKDDYEKRDWETKNYTQQDQALFYHYLQIAMLKEYNKPSGALREWYKFDLESEGITNKKISYQEWAEQKIALNFS